MPSRLGARVLVHARIFPALGSKCTASLFFVVAFVNAEAGHINEKSPAVTAGLPSRRTLCDF